MNIFYLHYNTRRCARYHVDRHVVKMILETAQLLCTAIIIITNDENTGFCKATHKNHPCAIWVRKSKANWLWLKELGLALCKEYTLRYEKKHKYEDKIEALIVPDLEDVEFTEPPQAMPEEYKNKESSVIAYRQYYISGKKHLHHWKTRHAWKNRKIPKFILKAIPEYNI
jgi:hypothetical protein